MFISSLINRIRDSIETSPNNHRSSRLFLNNSNNSDDRDKILSWNLFFIVQKFMRIVSMLFIRILKNFMEVFNKKKKKRFLSSRSTICSNTARLWKNILPHFLWSVLMWLRMLSYSWLIDSILYDNKNRSKAKQVHVIYIYIYIRFYDII